MNVDSILGTLGLSGVTGSSRWNESPRGKG